MSSNSIGKLKINLPIEYQAMLSDFKRKLTINLEFARQLELMTDELIQYAEDLSFQ